MVDRLYKPSQVKELIGVAHVSEVYREIQLGRLKAKRRVCRGEGKRPRLVIQESAVNEYIAALPDNEPKAHVPAPVATPKAVRRRNPALPSSVQRELDEAPKYV